MPPKRRNPGANAKSPATPIDAKQRALIEQQEQLARKREQLERVIKEAPKKAEERKKLRQEELRTRRVDATVLIDRRFDTATTAGALPRRRHKPLRSQQRQARLVFLALLCGLLVLVIWLWSVWRW